MKILGKKNTRRVNKMLKGVSAVGTIGRKTGHFVEGLGKAEMMVGGMTGNTALAGLGLETTAAGDAMQVGGIAVRHTSEGIRKGDKSKFKSGVKHALKVI